MSFTPFPARVLPEPLSLFVTDAADAIGCDESYIALPLLSALASAIGNTRRIRLKKTWTEPAVVWTAIVAPSGAMKSAPIELAIKWVRRRQEQLLKDYRAAHAEYEDEYRTWKHMPKSERGDEPLPPLPMEHTYTSDITVEALADRLEKSPRGVLVAVDELAGWFGSFNAYKSGGGDVAHWLSMHRAGAVKVDRKSAEKPTLWIPHAAVSIAGGIQPRILRRVLSAEFYENGLAARLLLAMPPVKPKRWTENEVDDATMNAVQSLFEGLYQLKPATGIDGSPMPADVTLDDEAKVEWVRFFNTHNQAQELLTDDDLAAAFSKLEGYAARLALIIHCCRQAAGDESVDPWKIDGDSLRAGVALSQWFGGETVRVYGELSADEDEQETDKLLDLICTNGGVISERELARATRRYRKSGAATAALEALAQDGLGEWFYPPQPDTGGAPHRAFRLFHPGPAGDSTRDFDSASRGSVTIATVAGANSRAKAFEGGAEVLRSTVR